MPLQADGMAALEALAACLVEGRFPVILYGTQAGGMVAPVLVDSDGKIVTV